MARKARSPVAAIRKLLLVALVFCVLAVAGLFLFGKAGRRKAPQESAEARGGKGMTLIGEDFDYTFTEGERPIFHIKGESVKADKEGTLYLEGVGLTLYDKDGRVFHVESRKASFNRESNEGALQGDVVLKGPENLELRTARLDLRQKGERVLSRGPAEIRYGGQYIVHAGKLQIDIPAEEYVLQGGARVESLPGAETPVLMTSQRMLYERKKRWIRIEGGANLRRGQDWITARRIFGNLSDDESALKFVHAFWDIRGESHAAVQPAGGAPEPTRVRFSGKDLAVVFQPEANQVRRVELDGGEGGRATMEATGPAVVRTLTAKRIEGLLAEGVLSRADAYGGVEIRENSRASGKPVTRQANGQRASAVFRPDGQLASVDLDVNATYRDPQATATGNRASVDLDEGRGEFFGAPVVVTTDRGRMEAPRVVYNTDQQIVNARGGVKAVLQKVEETALAGTPLSEGEGPVHVESQEAFWRQQPSSFLFRGDVRAWRGENLLLAPELKGDKEADQLTATGGVKTLWFPTEKQAKATEAHAKPAKGAAGAKQRPSLVQVVSSDMTYEDKKGVLIYTGNVRVDQEGKTLACQRLEVEMDSQHQAQTMTCTGDTRVNDPKVGRRIDGQRAVYHVNQRQVDIFGDPVVMRDKDGNQVRGQRALYYLDDGRVEVKGKDEAAPAPSGAAAGQGSGG
ncbi:MAG TPA: LPS export ABC transporter periplasmic protein LptC [Thermoanaerobaculia bacterium]|jgi:lipopolysaccharide transport protein LptA/LPS export ABC transporter protein LptC|nr:LPS export ABC transporter periplasmic protein LptC [Thermoanaerobaculia bacterium]